MIDILASSSVGNCYRWPTDKGDLLIECGISVSDIMRGCNYKAPVACLLTHEHADHSKAAGALSALGVTLYASAGTLGRIRGASNSVVLQPMKAQKMEAGFTVLPFPAVHDAAEPMGFVIVNGDDRLLFATDTGNIPYEFKNLTEIFLECNYSEALIAQSDLDGNALQRIASNHMSLERVLKFLEVTDLSKVRRITLLHLSSGHSDEAGFIKAVQEATGIPCLTAKK